MRKTQTAPAPVKDTPSTSVDVVAVTKRIMDRMDAQRADVARLRRAVQAALE
jgi:hypothetical protein